MKLLLDENLSRRLVPFLQTDYPGTSQVALLGLEGATDRALWDHAKTQDYVLVTKDSDYRELSTLLGSPPQVILLKLGNSDKATVLHALQRQRAEIESLLKTPGIDLIEID